MAVALHDKWSGVSVQRRPLQAELYSVRHRCCMRDQNIAYLQFREQVVETSKLSG